MRDKYGFVQVSGRPRVRKPGAATGEERPGVHGGVAGPMGLREGAFPKREGLNFYCRRMYALPFAPWVMFWTSVSEASSVSGA